MLLLEEEMLLLCIGPFPVLDVEVEQVVDDVEEVAVVITKPELL
jgi:hypothetical protein